VSATARADAARCVAAVLAGRSLDEALRLHGAADAEQAGLVRAIAYGSLREYRLLDALAAALLERPLRGEPELHALLLCGLYQLRSMRVPAHAAVAETVAAAAILGKPWGKGLVNAVLRRYQRERAALDAALPQDPAVLLSYPDWLVRAIRSDWPEAWEAVLAAGSQPGPLALRVNARRGGREAYLATLAAAGIGARTVPVAPDAVVLDTAVPVEQIPGFADGAVSVQDVSAQLAADLLQAAPGQRVLDACAAPGGKAAHLLERCADLDLTAADHDAARLERVRQTLQRLRLSAHLRVADAAQAASWWDGQGFDRILLDAPCSGTGVIRRHPDIKWLRRAGDIPKMAAQQGRLLRALWPLLAPGGTLLYATCSILRAEGEDVVKEFLGAQADARESVIEAAWGQAGAVGRRIAPGGDFDGFYYARLARLA
jgi:16S rRNA (cytosine967-C5)-methyltransferase